MTDHTPEPWTDDELRQVNGLWVRVLAMNSPDWERAKACVNACAGIPTERLEDYWTKVVSTLTEQNWDRLAACANACAGIPTERLGDVKALVEASGAALAPLRKHVRTEDPQTTLERMKKEGSPYTRWWLALPIEEKNRLRHLAGARAAKLVAKVMHRSGTEYNYDPAVNALLNVIAGQFLELATDIECLHAYETAYRELGAVDTGAGI